MIEARLGCSAICGSSNATAVTMSKVVYLSIRKLGYADDLSTGVIAASGTLGTMIPPSAIMVIYGLVTEPRIGKLFAAGAGWHLRRRTATEGAGIGVSGALFFSLARGALTPRTVFEILAGNARTTAMPFTILIAAVMFATSSTSRRCRRPEEPDPAPRVAAGGYEPVRARLAAQGAWRWRRSFAASGCSWPRWWWRCSWRSNSSSWRCGDRSS